MRFQKMYHIRTPTTTQIILPRNILPASVPALSHDMSGQYMGPLLQVTTSTSLRLVHQMLMERHLNKKARRSSHKNHINGPKKRTEEDDERFTQSFEKMIKMAQESEM